MQWRVWTSSTDGHLSWPFTLSGAKFWHPSSVSVRKSAGRRKRPGQRSWPSDFARPPGSSGRGSIPRARPATVAPPARRPAPRGCGCPARRGAPGPWGRRLATGLPAGARGRPVGCQNSRMGGRADVNPRPARRASPARVPFSPRRGGGKPVPERNGVPVPASRGRRTRAGTTGPQCRSSAAMRLPCGGRVQAATAWSWMSPPRTGQRVTYSGATGVLGTAPGARGAVLATLLIRRQSLVRTPEGCPHQGADGGSRYGIGCQAPWPARPLRPRSSGQVRQGVVLLLLTS